MQNIGENITEIKDFKLKTYDSGNMISKYDISLIAKETENKIGFGIEYCTKLFKKSSIIRFAQNYINILKYIVKHKQSRIYEIDVLTMEEKNKIMHQFNQTYARYDRDLPIHQLFERQVRNLPDKTALVCKQEKITYEELNSMANCVALRLIKSGLKQGCIVGLIVNRSIEMLAGILGILKAGGAYLPIDPTYPDERIRYMLEDSNVEIILTQESLRHKVETDIRIIDLTNQNIYVQNCKNQEIEVKSNDLAYVIYTSGSTGNPKGVMIEHMSVNNLVKGITDKIGFEKGKTILALTTVSFDIFVLETIVPLCVGMKIILADENEQMDPRLLSKLINNNNVDMVQMTPSRLNLFMAHKESFVCIGKIKDIIVGGEAFPTKLLEELKKITTARIYNVYGPTETTVWSTTKELTNSTKVTIGRPIANTRIYIMNKYFTLEPIGAFGQLCIAGDALARGYINMPELTNKNFVKSVDEDRIYCTGDVARWLSDGEIEILGRLDNQVKVRGYRIELGEIESCLLKLDEIKEAVVVEKSDDNDTKYLCAYVVARDEIKVSKLRENLLKKLPEYMVPAFFIQLEKIPTTLNGKIARNLLPNPVIEAICTNIYNPPQNDMEHKISKIWEKVLGVDLVGVTDNFFELGGDSIKALQVSIYMNKIGLKAEIRDIFHNVTVRGLSNLFLTDKNEDNEDNKNILEEFCKIKETKETKETCLNLNNFNITSNQLEKINNIKDEEIEMIYPLSSMQQGILFYSRLTSDTESYVEQMCFAIDGNLNFNIFEESLDLLTKRYDVLRTNFIYQNMAKPVQVVYKEKKTKLYFEDISTMDEIDQKKYFLQYKITDRKNSFDLTKDPLMRVSIIRLNKEKYKIIWTRHHILMDGWCMNIIIKEFLVVYGSKVNGIAIKLNKSHLYYNYIKWVTKQDTSKAIEYWSRYLNDYDHCAVLPKSESGKINKFEVEEYVIWFDNEIMNKLKNITVNNRITLSSLLQSVWGIILQWYNNTQDVVFGAVVSGRPSEVEGIENMVGLFVNTVPIRVKCSSTMTVVDLAKQIQEEALIWKKYEYVSLADIQSKTKLKNNLFENIVVFENYPELENSLNDIPDIDFKASDFEAFEKSSYFFNIIIHPGKRLMIKFGYNSLVYSQNIVKDIATRMESIIQKIIENPEIIIHKLDIFTQEEKLSALKQYYKLLPLINRDNENIHIEFDLGNIKK
jgi:amino acid adenylation domain-containing protein